MQEHNHLEINTYQPTIIEVEETTIDLIKDLLNISKSYITSSLTDHLAKRDGFSNKHLFDKITLIHNGDLALINRCEDLLNKKYE